MNNPDSQPELNVSETLYSISKHLRTAAFDKRQMAELPGIKDLQTMLNLSQAEILVLALIYGFQSDGENATSMRIKILTRSYITDYAYLQDVMAELEKLKLIFHRDSDSGMAVYIPNRVFTSLRKNKYHGISELKPVGLEKMLRYFYSEILNHSRISSLELEYELEYLANLNPDLNIVNQVFRIMQPLEVFVILGACVKKYFYNEPFETTYLLLNFTDRGLVRELLNNINMEKMLVIQSGHLRLHGSDMIGEEPMVELTEDGEEMFLKELPSELRSIVQTAEAQMPSHALLPDQISPVKLLFDTEMERQVKDVETLVMPKFYNQYIATLKPSARMKGITVLMHGSPGTGKTELALQLARKSNRTLFRIDVSQILSKWVGDSEKNLRARFREYRRYVKKVDPSPILFLNECDQLLGKRIAITQSVDQMRNSMQNMLLEELETFEGILIATTNMTQNLDDAFERRFLYKLRFNPASPSMLAKLWKSAIPRLSEAQCQTLSSRYPFSPGEMQNIATKLQLRRLLNPKAKYFDTVLELCKEEKWGEEGKVRVGF